MVSSELIAALRGLSRADQFQVLQLLITELAQSEPSSAESLPSRSAWAAYDPVEAANTLLQALQEISPKPSPVEAPHTEEL
ncbi:MAG: hypothetical protein WBA57_21995 [Elainellaceae cyanobacterium]